MPPHSGPPCAVAVACARVRPGPCAVARARGRAPCAGRAPRVRRVVAVASAQNADSDLFLSVEIPYVCAQCRHVWAVAPSPVRARAGCRARVCKKKLSISDRPDVARRTSRTSAGAGLIINIKISISDGPDVARRTSRTRAQVSAGAGRACVGGPLRRRDTYGHRPLRLRRRCLRHGHLCQE